MKLHPNLLKSSKMFGYATMAVVSAMSLTLISLLTYLLIGNINSFQAQSRAQVKQDFSQKEDAILTALLHIVPNKAIGAMQENSNSSRQNYTWEAIFNEALTLANAEQAASPELLDSLDLSDAISSNTGDTVFESADELVRAPSSTPNKAVNKPLVNGGNWWEYTMLFENGIHDYIPAPLMVSHADYQLDQVFPIISTEKKYVYNYQAYDNIYHKGLHVSSDAYPLYNLIDYPDIKFGYKRPGQKFVAKRNWWVFSLTFGAVNEQRTGIPPVKKKYALSIYEIPSQLPLSATSGIKVGQYENGTDWRNVTISGGVNADVVQTIGTVDIEEGAISARKSVSLSDQTYVGNQKVENAFDEMGGREKRALQSDSDFYDASTGGNVGKVAFIPINPGTDFLKRASDGSRSSRISPTGWNDYSRGANQAQMRLEVTEMISDDIQVPRKFRLYLRNEYGGVMVREYERGNNWPTEAQYGGSSFPFQSGELSNLRNALIVHLDRLPGFLESIPDAGHIDKNNSIHITAVGPHDSVQTASIPSLASDMAVTLRDGKDMTDYTKGFSIVTDHRLYIAETINATKATLPAHSGLPSGTDFYPPLSLFAPEKRFGESLDAVKPVMLAGQLGSLKNTTGDTFNPLELKKSNDEVLEAHRVAAELTSIKSPAELPPINLMNWMITIEEIHE